MLKQTSATALRESVCCAADAERDLPDYRECADTCKGATLTT